MAENKTKATKVSVASYLKSITNEKRRKECEQIAKLMAGATGEKATMWGPTIIGFGSYHYKYESGHEGDMCIVGFASRASEIALYLSTTIPGRDALLAKLGKHKQSKACLYIKSTADVDMDVLEQMVKASYDEIKAKHS